MEAVDLLHRAEAAGLRVSHNGDSLVVRGPRSVASLSLVEELRQHKDGLLAYLRGEGQSTVAFEDSLPLGAVPLLDRLRKGIQWLTTTHKELMATEVLHTRQEALFLKALDEWDRLEAQLRTVFPQYQMCVLGPERRCPEEAPVTCRWCADAKTPLGKHDA
ncbi:MAG: hypothetical protein V1724_00675 [Chloroflexota bacterium]